ncbi:MAG: metallophosphoesterase family protein, partial [Haloferula sp.]
MRYAIFSDVHANLRAWESVLEDIRAQEVDMLICLGDVVGYGPKPVEVLESIRAVTSNFVMGNHDAAAIGAMDYSVFNDHARHSTEWTAAALTDEAREFLSSVPIAIEADEILFVHAEVAEPGRFDYIKDVESAEESFAAGDHFVTFVGHTHHPKIFERTRNGRVIERPDADMVLKSSSRYIVNVGSVGEPRTADDLRARYVVYDSAKRKVEFRAVMFDIPAYRRDLDGTELKVTPFFLSIFEQETGMLAQEWLIEHEVAPLANSDWVSASGATGTVQLQEESKPKSVWMTRVLPAVAALVVLAVPAIWGALRFIDSRQDESGMILPQASADQEVGRVAVVEESGAAGGIDFDAPLGPVPPPEPEPEPEMAGSDPSGEAGNLAVMEPKEVPAPPVVRKPAPAPEPAAPPVPQQPKGPVVAWWRMEQAAATLEDLENKHPL